MCTFCNSRQLPRLCIFIHGSSQWPHQVATFRTHVELHWQLRSGSTSVARQSSISFLPGPIWGPDGLYNRFEYDDVISARPVCSWHLESDLGAPRGRRLLSLVNVRITVRITCSSKFGKHTFWIPCEIIYPSPRKPVETDILFWEIWCYCSVFAKKIVCFSPAAPDFNFPAPTLAESLDPCLAMPRHLFNSQIAKCIVRTRKS